MNSQIVNFPQLDIELLQNVLNGTKILQDLRKSRTILQVYRMERKHRGVAPSIPQLSPSMSIKCTDYAGQSRGLFGRRCDQFVCKLKSKSRIHVQTTKFETKYLEQ